LGAHHLRGSTRPFSRRGRVRQRRGGGRRLKLGSALLIVLGFLASGAIGAGAYFLPLINLAVKQTGKSVVVPGVSPTAMAGTHQPFTLLLMGSDNDQKFCTSRSICDPKAKGTGLLTQSMILVRFDPVAHSVTMFSIPRDLYVPLSTGGTQKIMVAFSYGGANAAIATVERDFQVHVDQYAWIGLQGLINIINKFGGVDVPVLNPVLDDAYPADINSNDPYGTYRVAVLPGAQHLDGAHALEYVRSRHSDLRGDFGRSIRQQQVLLALRDQSYRVSAADLPDLAAAFANQFLTSMSIQDIASLLPAVRDIGPSQIRQVTLVDGYTTGRTLPNGEDVLLPDWSRILPLVHQYFPAT